MATKTLKTRVINKHDIEAHWERAKNFIPKQAEIIVYDDRYINSDGVEEIVADKVRYKIGDGVTNVNELPFANAGDYDDIREQVESRNFGENNIVDDTIVNVFGNNNITMAKAFNIIRYKADAANHKTLFVVNGDCSNLISQEVTAIIDATNTRFGKVENAIFDGSNTTVTVDTYWLEQCFDPKYSNESFFIADATNTWVDIPQDNEDLDNILFFPDSPQSGTKTIGDNAIVLGNGNEATMTHSIAIGRDNKAEGKYAVAIGRDNRAGYAAYAEGRANKAYGTYSHAEGNLNKSTGWYSHTEGVENKAIGGASHAEGKGTIAEGHQSHTEGLNTKVQAVEGYVFYNGEGSHAEGGNTVAGSNYCHAEGLNTKAYGSVSHAEGVNTQALGSHSHAEGLSTIASGNYSHAEGFSGVTASGKGAHAEGQNTTASGETSHAEGSGTKATKHAAHAEGNGTQAIGDQSHTEGLFTIASGARAHAEGWSTEANAAGAHSAGIATIAGSQGQTAVGIANENKTDNIFEVGNGVYEVRSDKAVATSRSNAFEVKRDGTVYSQEGKLATEAIVDEKIATKAEKVNWNESDETSLSFIKNRTHYGASEPIVEELVAEHHNPADYYLSEHVNNVVMVHRYGSGINEWYKLTIETKDLTDKDGNLIENTACINLDNKFIIWGHDYYITYEEYQAMDSYERQAYFEELGWEEYIKWYNIAKNKYENGDRNAPIICLCVNEYDGNVCSYEIYNDLSPAEKVLDPRYIPTDIIASDIKEDISVEIDNKLADLVGSAPETLNTLNELADALGDDPNFATTVSNRIGLLETGKVDKITGKGLSTNDFTDAYKTKLDNIDYPVDSVNGKTGNVTLSATDITEFGYLKTHPENSNSTIIPYLNNDLAFLTKKGGSVNYYSTTATDFTPVDLEQQSLVINEFDNVFDGTSSYALVQKGNATTVVIDLQLAERLYYNNKFYIDFGVDIWGARSIAIYAMDSDSDSNYNLLQSTTSPMCNGTFWYCNCTNNTNVNGDGRFDKLRIVLSNFNGDSPRIAEIGIINYNSKGTQNTFVSRGGCNGMYGDLLPHYDNQIDLGHEWKKWRNVYTNKINNKGTVTSSDSTPMEIVASGTQPTPVAGKTIIWIDTSQSVLNAAEEVEF